MRRIAIVLFFCSSAMLAQTPSPTPQLSPQSAYDQAIRPLEITRRSVANWSDSETAALAVAVKLAQDQCSARTAAQYSGEDLIAFARLCALGQQWASVKDAATLYVNVQHRTDPEAKAASFPGLTQAYAYLIDSSLHLNDPQTALSGALDMLSAVPYTSLTSQVTNETVRYLQLINTPEAVALLNLRQAVLLPLIRSSQLTKPSDGAESQSSITLPTLYNDALSLAAIQQLDKDPEAASATFAQVEVALPSNLSVDDSLLVAESRRQYALLGEHLPVISASAYLLNSPYTELPPVNTNFGASTALLLFPDWCAQCVRMGPQVAVALLRNNQKDIHFYALLATTASAPTQSPAETSSIPHPKTIRHTSRSVTIAAPSSEPKSPAELLEGTPTLLVPSNTLASFAATDFPLLIVTDHDGFVRFIEPAPDNTLVPGGLLDQVTSRILEKWPPSPTAP